MNDFECTKEEQIQNLSDDYGHLVILGAGASKASCIDNPEKYGRPIPLMNDLPKIIDLEPFLSDISHERKQQNFEKLFSELYLNEGNSERIKNIEEEIRNFFLSLQLPDTPTIYDYIVNWDPFLVQAYLRNSRFTTNLPKLLFFAWECGGRLQ